MNKHWKLILFLISKKFLIHCGNLFIRDPAGASGGVEWPLGSGILYQRKAKHTIWNSNWNDQRIKEEIAFAFSNKKVKKLRRITNATNGQEQILYESLLSDGTLVEIKMTNFDNYLGNLYHDHMNIFALVI